MGLLKPVSAFTSTESGPEFPDNNAATASANATAAVVVTSSASSSYCCPSCPLIISSSACSPSALSTTVTSTTAELFPCIFEDRKVSEYDHILLILRSLHTVNKAPHEIWTPASWKAPKTRSFFLSSFENGKNVYAK